MDGTFLFNLLFGFMFTCFSPTQFGVEGLFLPDNLATMHDVMNTAEAPRKAPDNNDEKKKTETIFAAIPNETRDELAKWCESCASSEDELPTLATEGKQGLRARSSLGKMLKKGGHRRLNMHLG